MDNGFHCDKVLVNVLADTNEMLASDPQVPGSENPHRSVITVGHPPHGRLELSFG